MGFCGCAISVKVASSVFTSEQLDACVVIGGLHCDLDDPWFIPGAVINPSAGRVIEDAAIKTLLQTPDLLQGSPVISGGIFTNKFDLSPSYGWSYLADTNRCRGKICHRFAVLCFIRVPETTLLKCIGSCTSSRFDVSSAKRGASKTASKVLVDTSAAGALLPVHVSAKWLPGLQVPPSALIQKVHNQASME
jgi:hypothetical protein